MVILGPLPMFFTGGFLFARGIPQLVVAAAGLTVLVAALPLPRRPRRPGTGQPATHPTRV